MRWLGAVLLLACVTSGCSVADLTDGPRLARGLVVVLPGIEGRSQFNVNIARGLDSGGVHCAIEIYDWNTKVPFGSLVNLTFIDRNREQARALSARILEYQRDYPGRPVHLVGHSGGGGLAVMALEAHPRNSPMCGAILLAPAVSPEYDLRRALRRADQGIVNCYSKLDVMFLELGTGLFGNVDRGRGPAAGAVGFDVSRRSMFAEYDKLKQLAWSQKMIRHGHYGGHFGWADRTFVSRYLAPIIMRQQSGTWIQESK